MPNSHKTKYKNVCEYCGVSFETPNKNKRFCSAVCSGKYSNKIAKEKNLEKYGVENYFQSNDFKAKAKRTLLEKYGTDNAMKNKEVLERSQKTQIEKYGSLGFNQPFAKKLAMINSHTKEAEKKRLNTLLTNIKNSTNEEILRSRGQCI